MNSTANSLSREQNAFAKRCAELGVGVWFLDVNGETNSPPTANWNWLDTAAFRQQLALESRDLVRNAPLKILSPGCQALFLEQRQGSRRLWIAAAIILTEPIWPADVPPQKIHSPESLHTLTKSLQWSFDDLIESSRTQQTLQQFSERLSQAYEENNLLFRLSRALNCDTAPADLVQMILGQLLDIFPFQWIAIRFRDHDHDVRDLSGKLLLAGNLPANKENFDQLCAKMLSELTAKDDWTKLLAPHESPIAALVNAEIVAEPITHDNKVIGVMLAGNKQGPDAPISSFETQFLDAASGFLGIFHENIARFAEQEAQFLGTLRALSASIDAKDRYTCGHSERVAHLAAQMAEALKFDTKIVEDYRVAGQVHDVGKIGVPEAVLCKTGRPTEEEFAELRKHPRIGYEILKGIPRLESALPGVLHHHERWDGNGYPEKIGGETIPLMARVMALADTFDAMSSNRSYRPALSRGNVLAEILRCSGTQFDPALAPIFVTLDFAGFDLLIQKHQSIAKAAA
jgi:HD-GYP domain-containing protein (c-di-GMP phosphodiesterase class II)